MLYQQLAAAATSLAAAGQIQLDARLSGCVGEQSADLDFYDLA